ncbi:hypothetical protein ACSSS7_004720 [Eimeria intestinalis]
MSPSRSPSSEALGFEEPPASLNPEQHHCSNQACGAAPAAAGDSGLGPQHSDCRVGTAPTGAEVTAAAVTAAGAAPVGAAVGAATAPFSAMAAPAGAAAGKEEGQDVGGPSVASPSISQLELLRSISHNTSSDEQRGATWEGWPFSGHRHVCLLLLKLLLLEMLLLKLLLLDLLLLRLPLLKLLLGSSRALPTASSPMQLASSLSPCLWLVLIWICAAAALAAAAAVAAGSVAVISVGGWSCRLVDPSSLIYRGKPLQRPLKARSGAAETAAAAAATAAAAARAVTAAAILKEAPPLQQQRQQQQQQEEAPSPPGWSLVSAQCE